MLVLSALAIAPLLLLGGQAPLVQLLSGFEGSIQSLSNVDQLLQQIYALIWVGVVVLCCAAWPTRLSVRGALGRLGVGPLHRRDALPLVAVIAVSVAVGVALDWLNRAVLTSLGWPMTDPTVVTRLVPVATTAYGAIVVALCAGSSEELMFRGLLQPRLGWLLADLAFAAGHGFQYGLDGLIAVFVLGADSGLRPRTLEHQRLDHRPRSLRRDFVPAGHFRLLIARRARYPVKVEPGLDRSLRRDSARQSQ